MAAKRANINKGLQLYHKLLKQFTKVNNQLPEDRKVSLEDRRKYVTKKLYPQYKGISASRVGVKAINKSIEQVLSTIIPQEGCDLNYISPSVAVDIAWFDLDDYIREVLPKCIYIKIDAGQFGVTNVFNTLNYNYDRNGVKGIVDKIRDFVNNDTQIDVSFTGYKQLRRGKANDGTPENYYLHFILVVNSEEIKDTEPVVYNGERRERKKITSVKNAILARVKDLANKKKRKKNARKKAITKIQKVRKLKQQEKRSVRPETKQKRNMEKINAFVDAQKQIKKSFDRGNLTPEQYERMIADLVKAFSDIRKQGGEI